MWSLCILLVSVTAQILASWLGHTSHAVGKKIMFDLNDAEELYQEFLQTYEKTVEEEEYNTRLEVFKKHLINMNELNEKQDSAVFGITQFADMTDEEWSMFNPLMNSTEGIDCNMYGGPYGPAPASLDYREKNMVTPVKNQGGCGSCYSFSSLGAVEGAYARKTGNLVSFSEQQIVDCDAGGNGCNGGWMPQVFSYIYDYGIELDSSYPYAGAVEGCSYDATKVATKVSSCQIISVTNEEDLTSALDKFGPLSIGVAVGNEWRGYQGGILQGCPADTVNHGVLLVGYGTDSGVNYWLVKNSWGVGFGEEGYIRLARGQNACNILNVVSAVEI